MGLGSGVPPSMGIAANVDVGGFAGIGHALGRCFGGDDTRLGQPHARKAGLASMLAWSRGAAGCDRTAQ